MIGKYLEPKKTKKEIKELYGTQGPTDDQVSHVLANFTKIRDQITQYTDIQTNCDSMFKDAYEFLSSILSDKEAILALLKFFNDQMKVAKLAVT